MVLEMQDFFQREKVVGVDGVDGVVVTETDAVTETGKRKEIVGCC